MKLSVFLLLCSIGLAQATDSYAQKATVNLEMRNQTVKEVLDEIEEQSDFSFFFNIKHVDLHRRVSVVAKKSDIFKVLETVFAGTDVRYSVVDRKIILSTEKQEIQQINQDKKVTGVIKDQHGEPVIGANVSVKGTTIGTITGIDGDFALEVPANAVIQVSYIGYVPQELRLGGKNHLDVVLKEDSQALDEIVVVGYGVQKKINLTGSVSSVKSEELERQPIVTMKDALAGLVPGLTVVKSSGQPGSSNPTITVRGVGTWKNAGPLVLVDGMSMSIADVLPNDIESISVLKDAASAAIYGSRAA
ncbi:MAG TPA: SusC/RagA family TonB-linked outer membrane protein, partial [Parabacteroides goldsteinii]|nr:SusC/RagA family TonB-linked outer membrane protein [Parabacteroides goldsteinii]